MSESSNERDPVGTVTEEARKLFEALQGHATRRMGKTILNSFRPDRRERDVWSDAVGDHEYVCRACPFCRAIAAQRESGSEVAGQLAAVGGELFAAFRQAWESLSGPAPRSRPAEEARPEGAGQNVEHIDLG